MTLDHYEVRTWDAWHRFVTLCLLAHAGLVVMRPAANRHETAEKGAAAPLDPDHRARGSSPVPGADRQPRAACLPPPVVAVAPRASSRGRTMPCSPTRPGAGPSTRQPRSTPADVWACGTEPTPNGSWPDRSYRPSGLRPSARATTTARS